ncbi:hypothetical protein AJ80_02855 [Polytolypa hystricis UAMH7299]|uniref:Uncharacterized protein n=1 Tax=Polytolypa hystricis (strain UAMH7299) TaxID=1447883 RepID=A0A2B7YPU6_POLH7|nr:hypothetical protein AJ80_02855 [Polytolypa hystricis UAMH7299]
MTTETAISVHSDSLPANLSCQRPPRFYQSPEIQKLVSEALNRSLEHEREASRQKPWWEIWRRWVLRKWRDNFGWSMAEEAPAAPEFRWMFARESAIRLFAISNRHARGRSAFSNGSPDLSKTIMFGSAPSNLHIAQTVQQERMYAFLQSPNTSQTGFEPSGPMLSTSVIAGFMECTTTKSGLVVSLFNQSFLSNGNNSLGGIQSPNPMFVSSIVSIIEFAAEAGLEASHCDNLVQRSGSFAEQEDLEPYLEPMDGVHIHGPAQEFNEKFQGNEESGEASACSHIDNEVQMEDVADRFHEFGESAEPVNESNPSPWEYRDPERDEED